jgi:acyl-CoA synthetase (AMP-forming)/AMP-acid ligase II
MNLFERYCEIFREYGHHDAFCHDEDLYSYEEFLGIINGIRMKLEDHREFAPETPAGIICFDDVYTYASIFAVWFSGCIFVPLNPLMPQSYNEELIQRHNIRMILSSGYPEKGMKVTPEKLILTKHAEKSEMKPVYKWHDRQIAYVLTTSGSTGMPKHVPINHKNLSAYVNGFLSLYPDLGPQDKYLQTYDLTSDGAFTGYLIPFITGASVYTVSQKYFKPMGVAKVLNSKPITWVKLTPSMLACLRPFFSSFNLPGIRHFLFAGEALPAGLAEEWRKSVPNALISNLYGPTETTVTALIYKCHPGEPFRSLNQTVSIGKPFGSVKAFIQPLADTGQMDTGEMLIAGDQVMENYLFADHQPFVTVYEGGKEVKYYPAGDLVTRDEEGYYYFSGRKDDQVKINGYRTDLIEIENLVREHLPQYGNVAAVAVPAGESLSQLVVFVEGYGQNGDDLISTLAARHPRYKVPEKIVGVRTFPLLTSGKTDKKTLLAEYLQQYNT